MPQWEPEGEAGMPMGEDWTLPVFPSDGQDVWDEPAELEAAERKPDSLYEAPKKQRQLLDFLLLYPEPAEPMMDHPWSFLPVRIHSIL